VEPSDREAAEAAAVRTFELSDEQRKLPLAILVLVLQKARPKGWQVCDGAILTFDQVVKHLRAIAVAFAGVRIWCTATELVGGGLFI
jgi:hypothetical protein